MQTEAIRAARPHVIRAVAALVVMVAAIAVAGIAGDVREGATRTEQAVGYSAAALVLLSGIAAVRSFAGAIRAGAETRDAAARGSALSFIASIAGYIVVVLTALGVLRVNLAGLLVGGALTGVVLGIAAQQTIGNFFAGIVLLVVRPFSIGEHIVLRSGPLGGEYEGTVSDMSIFYVHLNTALGPVALPNAGVLAAAIGPGARSAANDELPDDEPPA